MTTELQAAAAEIELKDYEDLGEALEECQKMLEAERAKVKELEELLNAATDDYSSLHKLLSESGVDFSKTLKDIEETSSLLKRCDYDGYKSVLFNERAKVKKLREALEDLYDLVKGESSPLLDEDSGGDAELDYNITKALRETADDLSKAKGR